MIALVEDRRAELKVLCQRFHVKTLELFGSATTTVFDPMTSDFDFLVEFLPEAEADAFANFFDLQAALESLFGRKVDLLMPKAIRNPHLKRAVESQRTSLYAA